MLALAVVRGAARSGRETLGPADVVTLMRALLGCAAAALTTELLLGHPATPALLAVVVPALVLDAVDGRVARRTGTTSAFGGRFDGEVDAFVILVLSMAVAPVVGWWALGAGAARYAFGGAGRVLPWLRGERLDLTPTEYKLLYHLVRNAGHVLEHGTLLAKVWGREYVDEVDYVRVYIRRLRDKLGDPADAPRYIRTERGLGYRFIGPS